MLRLNEIKRELNFKGNPIVSQEHPTSKTNPFGPSQDYQRDCNTVGRDSMLTYQQKEESLKNSSEHLVIKDSERVRGE